MQITIINGPNLNLLGKREPEIYGRQTFEDYLEHLREVFADVTIHYYQSNVEGEIINYIQLADRSSAGIILNAGGYTHTSVSIADAVGAISIPVIEVHISHPLNREDYRHISIIGTKCRGSISGFGLLSYQLAIQGLIELTR